MQKYTKKIFPWYAVFIFDVLAIGAALIVFAIFHHALPQKGEAIQSVGEIASTPVPIATPAPENSPITQAETTPVPTPTPTPRIGDFSATFPTSSTAEADAIQSYQTDNLRVALYERRYVDDEDKNVCYYIADVYTRDISYMRTAFADGEFGRGILQNQPEMAQENNAVIAINGDYYGGRSKGIVIRNGVLYRDTLYEDICVLYTDGVMETYHRDEFDLEKVISRGAYQSWSFGPALLENGKAIEDFDSSIGDRHPRSIIGYYEPGHYALITVDGRKKKHSSGLSLVKLSALMEELGLTAAYNLDGGKTAMMMWQGEVVDIPYEGGRACTDLVYFSEEPVQ